jgi:hypothetical protein
MKLQKHLLIEHATSANTPQAFPALYATASCNVYALLESNRSHGNSFVRVCHELCMIFSKSKDEAWSQHVNLHHYGYGRNTIIDLSSQED